MSNILLIDIGNSRLKWAVARGTRIARGASVEHAGDPAAALARLAFPRADALWIAHVTGTQHERALTRAAQAASGLRPQYARSEKARLGLKNSYREPQRLGVDRWLAMLAAWSAYRSALCVADAGTALTVDCVDARGRHLGGIIAPGLATAQRALLGATRFATRDLNARYTQGLGRDTEACVRQGAYHACVGAIVQASAPAGAAATKIITGGDAANLARGLDGGWETRSQLVLEGLLALARDTA
jgi:type III pantothenate kinase